MHVAVLNLDCLFTRSNFATRCCFDLEIATQLMWQNELIIKVFSLGGFNDRKPEFFDYFW